MNWKMKLTLERYGYAVDEKSYVSLFPSVPRPYTDRAPPTGNLFPPTKNRSFTANPVDTEQVNRAPKPANASRRDAKPEGPHFIQHRNLQLFQPGNQL